MALRASSNPALPQSPKYRLHVKARAFHHPLQFSGGVEALPALMMRNVASLLHRQGPDVLSGLPLECAIDPKVLNLSALRHADGSVQGSVWD